MSKAASFPNALRTCIRQAGYSFREVSRETAIPESTLYDWASGKRPIPHHARDTLACLLGCDSEQLRPLESQLLTGTGALTKNSIIGTLLIYFVVSSGVRNPQRAVNTQGGPGSIWLPTA
jgi:hypothetical protein